MMSFQSGVQAGRDEADIQLRADSIDQSPPITAEEIKMLMERPDLVELLRTANCFKPEIVYVFRQEIFSLGQQRPDALLASPPHLRLRH